MDCRAGGNGHGAANSSGGFAETIRQLKPVKAARDDPPAAADRDERIEQALARSCEIRETGRRLIEEARERVAAVRRLQPDTSADSSPIARDTAAPLIDADEQIERSRQGVRAWLSWRRGWCGRKRASRASMTRWLTAIPGMPPTIAGPPRMPAGRRAAPARSSATPRGRTLGEPQGRRLAAEQLATSSPATSPSPAASPRRPEGWWRPPPTPADHRQHHQPPGVRCGCHSHVARTTWLGRPHRIFYRHGLSRRVACGASGRFRLVGNPSAEVGQPPV